MVKFVSPYHKLIHQLIQDTHDMVSKARRNRYKIGTNVLVYYNSGKACQVCIGDQSIQYYDPVNLELDIRVLPKPAWPAFSIVSVVAEFNKVLYRSMPNLPKHNPAKTAEAILNFSIQQVLNGEIDAHDL